MFTFKTPQEIQKENKQSSINYIVDTINRILSYSDECRYVCFNQKQYDLFVEIDEYYKCSIKSRIEDAGWQMIIKMEFNPTEQYEIYFKPKN